MAAVIEQGVSNYTTSGSGLSVSFTGVTVGNELFVGVNHQGISGETYSATGWTQLAVNEETYQSWVVYRKTATSTSETCTVNIAGASGEYITGVGVEVSGIESTLDQSDTSSDQNQTTPGASGNGGSITPTDSAGAAINFLFHWDERRANCTELSVSSPFTEQACADPGNGAYPIVEVATHIYSSTATLAPDWDSTRSNSGSWDTGAWIGCFGEASSGSDISVTTGALTIAGTNASIEMNRNVSVGTGALTIAAFNAGVELNRNVSVTTGALTIAGVNTVIDHPQATEITVTTGALVIAGVNAVVDQQTASETTIVVTTGALTVAGVNANIQQDNNISVGIGALTIAAVNTSVVQQVDVSVGTGALTIAGTNATIVQYGTNSIEVTTGSIAVLGYNVVVQGAVLTSWLPEAAALTSWLPEGAASTNWTPEGAASTSWTAET